MPQSLTSGVGARLNLVIETAGKNQWFKHRDVRVEMVSFEHVKRLSDAHHRRVEAIGIDRHLTKEGKETAIEEARATVRARDHRVERAATEEHRRGLARKAPR